MAVEKIYHMAELASMQARSYGNGTALKVRESQDGKKFQWKKISWTEVDEMVQRTSQSLIEFDVAPQEAVGIFSENSEKHIYADLAIYGVRGIVVPIYATSSVDQLEYIVSSTELKLIFVGDQLQYNTAYKLQKHSKTLKQIVIFETSVRLHPEDKTSVYYLDFLKLGDNLNALAQVKARRSRALRSDVANIIFTSGTSGQSKGVLITHNNIMVALEGHIQRIPDMNHSKISMCFLPMSHVFEKYWCYLCLQRGVRVAVCDKTKLILTYLKEVNPHYMCNVPRFWEKVYNGVQEKIEESGSLVQKVLKKGIELGAIYNLEYKAKGKRPPIILSLKYSFFNFIGFSRVKKAIGLSRGKFFPTAGAALAPKINEFLQSIGIPIIIGYGLSETTATVCFCPTKHFVLGSIGELLPGVRAKIDPKTCEILVKGGTIFSGYLNNPEATAAAFTDDGYFKTGDKGRLEGKTLFFDERLKDLFKTANGKYISPQMIEGLLSADKFIDQVAVIADGRNFVSALICPDWQAVRHELSKREVPCEHLSNEDLTKLHEVETLIEGRVEEAQQGLASYERIKRFTLLPNTFTFESGELTNTLKLKRKVVSQKYADIIDEMYRKAALEYKPNIEG